MKQRVLITGASGFVGFHLIEAALAKGLEVYAAVRKSSDVRHLQSYNLHYTYLDFTSVESIEKELKEKQYDYIIHAAGTTKAKNSEEYNKINAGYTTTLATAAANAGIKKFVFISSLAAIGPLSETTNFLTEQTSPSPVTSYGRSKLLAEEKLKEIKLPVVILRPTAVYGERDKEILVVFKTFAKGFEPYIGKAPQQLSFIYVKDLAAVTVSSLFTGDEANGAYNITDGNCYNRYELANISKNVLDKKTFRFHLPIAVVRGLALVLEKTYSMFDKAPMLNIEKLNELTAVNWCCDVTAAKQKLSFAPQYDLSKGLKEVLGWYRENKWI